MAGGWLTPDTLPSGFRTCELSFPDSEDWHSLVRGALFLLTQAENFEEFGAITAQETADTFLLMLERFFGDECMQIPVGTVLEFAGSVLPSGYLWADGAAVSRALYADLFDAIGVEFGVGNGTTTFNVPDRRGRVAVGLDPVDGDFDLLGATGGEKNHTLSTGEMPSHTHIQNSHNHAQDAHSHVVFGNNTLQGAGSAIRQLAGTTGNNNVFSQVTTATNVPQTAINQNSGGGAAHENMPPYLILNHIIRF